MTLHWETKLSREIILGIGMIGLAAAMAGAATLAGGNRTRGDPVLAAPTAQISDQGHALAESPRTLQFSVFISPRGDYRFEAPAAWVTPLDPRDLKLEAFFVGPVDQVHQTVVMMAVCRYPRVAQTASMESVIAQLQLDRNKHLLGTETVVVDQRPGRLVRIHEVASVLARSLEVFSIDLRESIVIVENGPEILALEYAASPDVYGEYWPIFDRLVTSFRFVSTP